MKKKTGFLPPEHVLGSIYGKTSKELRMTEKRRDEVLAACIFIGFRNQEFGTRFQIPADYREEQDPLEDSAGVDMGVMDPTGRKKKLQIKGIHIHRSIERRRQHKTKGAPHVFGRKTLYQIKRDSEELTKIMRHELEKIVQDYSGIYLILHVIADLASQTSLEIAIKNSREIVSNLKAREVWFLRQIPVRAVYGKKSITRCYTYKLIKVSPDRHVYAYSFSL